jgi:ADP-heptose:LPS heptosyltransferase
MTDSIQIIANKPPLYKYQRFNPYLRKLGRVIDLVTLRASVKPVSPSQILSEGKVLILESHLIGDGVMTLGLVNSLKLQSHGVHLILAGQPWLKDLVPAGLVENFIPITLPWVGSGVFSISLWWNFFKSLAELRKQHANIAMETRGDWRNFMLFWLLRIPTRIGTPMTGGQFFLTHVARVVKDDEPLYATREAILESLKLEPKLKLPELPAARTAVSADRPYVVIHPGASHPDRQMRLEKLKIVRERLARNHLDLFVAVGTGEFNLQQSVLDFFKDQGLLAKPWSGSLPEFLVLCQGAEMVFTMDSGPAHLASWCNDRVVIFCPHDSPGIVRPLKSFRR